MIRKSFIAIDDVDDATIREAVLLEAVAHDVVVAVGVDAEIVAAGEAELEETVHHAVTPGRTGNAMDNIVG